MSNSDEPIDVLAQQIARQIESFNNRRAKFGRMNNRLSVMQMICAAGSALLIALNIKYGNPIVSAVAIVLSFLAAGAIQSLQYFKFQERLQIAVATVSRLLALQAKLQIEIALDRKRLSKNLDEQATEMFNAFQSIELSPVRMTLG